MDGRTGWRTGSGVTGRAAGGRRVVIVAWALAMVLAGSALGTGSAAAEENTAGSGSGAERGTIDFRRASEPTAQERERMLRWHGIWREETAPLREVLGRFVGAEHAAPVADPRWCGTLGRAVLAVDRERVFPVPSYGVGARLRRALGALVRAANACFDRRSYEAGFRLAQAHEAFAQAGRLLRPYGVAP